LIFTTKWLFWGPADAGAGYLRFTVSGEIIPIRAVGGAASRDGSPFVDPGFILARSSQDEARINEGSSQPERLSKNLG
jgi:hypothetical protein